MYKIEDGVTYSLLSDWSDCRQRALFKGLGWEKDAPEKDSLWFGTKFHSYLEVLYRARQHPRQISVPIRGRVEQDREFDAAKIWTVFQGYCQHYKGEPWHTVAVEKVFDLQWYGFRLRGKIDRVVADGSSVLWDMETKTTSRFGSDQGELFMSMDDQGLFYHLALELMDYNPKGMVRDLVRTPQIRIKKDESEEKFLERLQEDIFHRPDFYFERTEVAFHPEQIKAYRKDLRNRLYSYRRWLKGKEATYTNKRSCVGFWNCEFLEACSTCTMSGYREGREHFRELKEGGNDVKNDTSTGDNSSGFVTSLPVCRS